MGLSRTSGAFVVYGITPRLGQVHKIVILYSKAVEYSQFNMVHVVLPECEHLDFTRRFLVTPSVCYRDCDP